MALIASGEKMEKRGEQQSKPKSAWKSFKGENQTNGSQAALVPFGASVWKTFSTSCQVCQGWNSALGGWAALA